LAKHLCVTWRAFPGARAAVARMRVIIVFGFVECRTLVVPGVSGGCYLSAAYNGAVVAEGITGFWSAFS